MCDYRTLLDIIAALVSILSAAIPNVKSPTGCDCSAWCPIGCQIFGIMNAFLFLASLTWYLVLSLEMYFAIKSPFRSVEGENADILLFHCDVECKRRFIIESIVSFVSVWTTNTGSSVTSLDGSTPLCSHL